MISRGRILLHTCCGVCASHCVAVLKADGWTPVLFFSNYNIAPSDEYARRLQAAQQLAAAEAIEFVEDTPDHALWRQSVAAGYEDQPEGGARCPRCFHYSLTRAFEAMKRLGCIAFTTSLTVSPHKPSALLHQLGKTIGGDAFVPYDFKKKGGFQDSNRRAAALSLYRQTYCGCEFSQRHRAPYRTLIAGMGYRGRIYAQWALEHPEDLQVIAIAEPDPAVRAHWQAKLHLPDSAVYSSWQRAINVPEIECTVIALPDRLHFPAAMAALAHKHHLLLEKPVGATWDECVALDDAVRSSQCLVQTGHILRYTPYYQKIAELIHGGTLGEVVSIQHLEPMSYWKAALVFCRGALGNTTQSTPAILQKCSHDFDLFSWWLGKRCLRVQSFGGLNHFRRECAPAGATDYCYRCPAAIERDCPYSAIKLLEQNSDFWYALPDTSPKALRALLKGPYGRCVYACDNDAVDHQIVNLQFEGGVTVSHCMEAYAWGRDRSTRVCCTRGEIIGNARTLTIHHFDTRTTELWDAGLEGGAASNESSYILGNAGLMRHWVDDLRSLPPALYAERFHACIQAHALAFAAEHSRLRGGESISIAWL